MINGIHIEFNSDQNKHETYFDEESKILKIVAAPVSNFVHQTIDQSKMPHYSTLGDVYRYLNDREEEQMREFFGNLLEYDLLTSKNQLESYSEKIEVVEVIILDENFSNIGVIELDNCKYPEIDSRGRLNCEFEFPKEYLNRWAVFTIEINPKVKISFMRQIEEQGSEYLFDIEECSISMYSFECFFPSNEFKLYLLPESFDPKKYLKKHICNRI